jgi:hypothetical protein
MQKGEAEPAIYIPIPGKEDTEMPEDWETYKRRFVVRLAAATLFVPATRLEGGDSVQAAKRLKGAEKTCNSSDEHFEDSDAGSEATGTDE